MTKMLIDRQVVEHALHVAIVAEHPVKLIAALRAALAEPQSTHSTECYQWHHKCAVAEVQRLRAEMEEIDSDGARCGVYSLPMWCDIHQHYKWCEHNGGVMGPTGWEKP